jgi:hypothetical protein
MRLFFTGRLPVTADKIEQRDQLDKILKSVEEYKEVSVK